MQWCFVPDVLHGHGSGCGVEKSVVQILLLTAQVSEELRQRSALAHAIADVAEYDENTSDSRCI
jgi:hypothetical protein